MYSSLRDLNTKCTKLQWFRPIAPTPSPISSVRQRENAGFSDCQSYTILMMRHMMSQIALYISRYETCLSNFGVGILL